jgi:hypothetical protein
MAFQYIITKRSFVEFLALENMLRCINNANGERFAKTKPEPVSRYDQDAQ